MIVGSLWSFWRRKMWLFAGRLRLHRPQKKVMCMYGRDGPADPTYFYRWSPCWGCSFASFATWTPFHSAHHCGNPTHTIQNLGWNHLRNHIPSFHGKLFSAFFTLTNMNPTHFPISCPSQPPKTNLALSPDRPRQIPGCQKNPQILDGGLIGFTSWWMSCEKSTENISKHYIHHGFWVLKKNYEGEGDK